MRCSGYSRKPRAHRLPFRRARGDIQIRWKDLRRLKRLPTPERPAWGGQNCFWLHHLSVARLPIPTGYRRVTATIRGESPDIQRSCEEWPGVRASHTQRRWHARRVGSHHRMKSKLGNEGSRQFLKNPMNQPDEFYIGWEAKAAPGVGKTVRKTVVVVLALALLAPILLAVSQRMIGMSVFEWGTHKTFSGILQVQPYPHLLVRRPGKADGLPRFATYYLVAPWKFGLDRETIALLDGKSVALKGTLIYRGNQTMIETKAEWIQAAEKTSATTPPLPSTSLGTQTLVGEIVDSKCFLGVMNPGQLTPHRACAIRCISGGVPPVLLVRQTNGPAFYFLLVSRDGKPVNKEVLDLVAEPVEITGAVERLGELLILRANPATYRRVKR